MKQKTTIPTEVTLLPIYEKKVEKDWVFMISFILFPY